MSSERFAERAAAHTCHADGCDSHVPPKMFMCRRHWFMVPRDLRDLVWATYRPGQEVRMDPTDEYLEVARTAIEAVAAAEASKSGRPAIAPTPRWARVALTGHRALSADEATFAGGELPRLAAKLRDRHSTTAAICGMALGVDTLWAEAALAAGLELWAYIPFETQAARWPADDQHRWERLRAQAAREVVVGDAPATWHYHARNDAMVRDADALIAVVDRTRDGGGSLSTLAKARAAGRPVIVVDLAARHTRLLSSGRGG